MPSVPMSVTTPSAIPSPGRMENVAEVVMTFLILDDSMPSSFALLNADSI